MVVKKFGCRRVALAGYASANRYVIVRFSVRYKLSVRVVFTVTAI